MCGRFTLHTPIHELGSFAATFAVQTLKGLVERHYKTYFFAF